MQISGRFVGDAYMRPVRFARYVALPGWLQRAAYMPPLHIHQTQNAILCQEMPPNGRHFLSQLQRQSVLPVKQIAFPHFLRAGFYHLRYNVIQLRRIL